MAAVTLPSSEAKISAYNYLWRILFAERKDLNLVIIYGIAVGIFSLVVPIAAQALVNTVIFNFLLQPIVILAFVVIGMLGVASILKLIQTAVVETIQTRIFVRVSMDLAYRLPRVDIEAYDKYRGNELINRFFEVVTIQKGLAFMLVDGLLVILQAVIGMVLLAFYHPLLLAFDVILLFFILLVIFLPSRQGVTTSMKESKAKYNVASWLEEVARNPNIFKLGGGSHYALARADEVTLEYLKARKSHFLILIQQITGTLLLQTIVSGLFLGLGSYLVIQKQLTLGQLVASEIIVTMVVSGFAKFGKYLETFYDLVASVDKLSFLFNLPLEVERQENSVLKSGVFSVSLKNLSFAYPDAYTETLRGINLEVLPGERLGIVGSNGAGKTTIFDLILGLRRPTAGFVELQGVDIRDASLEIVRKHVAIVRHVEIFDGTILDNIRVGRVDLSIDDVRDALTFVGLLDEISSLPEGLSTSLSGSLSPLSAGQAQRLMLARAIVGKPHLLLLDEALDDIDYDNKRILLKKLFDPAAPWTLIFATHDTYELGGCTRIVQLADGKVLPSNRILNGEGI